MTKQDHHQTQQHQHHHCTFYSESSDMLYEKLFEGNRKWVDAKIKESPEYFKAMSNSQSPKYMLIGCSDSRCPPDQLMQTQPGELFIHRNVANIVVNSDMNLMSVLQYAVANLHVEHIIVLGHYNCGGVKASMDRKSHGLIDKWLCHIKDVYRLHRAELDAIEDQTLRCRRLVELNVQEQVLNICKTSVVQRRWKADLPMHVHGCVYDLETGIVHDLRVSMRDVWEKNNHMYTFEFDKKEDMAMDSHTPRTPRSFSFPESLSMQDSDNPLINEPSPLSITIPPKRKVSWKERVMDGKPEGTLSSSSSISSSLSILPNSASSTAIAAAAASTSSSSTSSSNMVASKPSNPSLLGIAGGFIGLTILGIAWKSFVSAK